ncbi:MAG: N-acetylmuramoyl-L-alanine amidase [Candidatus Binataceae bacterium]
MESVVAIAGSIGRPLKRCGQGEVRRAALPTLALLAMTVAVAIARPAETHAATLTGASIESQGSAVELHFALRGHGLGWHLSIHGQELWIDLDNVRVQLAPRPLMGQEVAPVVAVRAIYAGGVTGRIVVEVKGRTDYVVGQLPHELILRVAPAGEVRNLGAPILMRMERRRNAPPRPSMAAQSRVFPSTSTSLAVATAGGRSRTTTLTPIQAADSGAERTTREYSAGAPMRMASRAGPSTLPAPASGHQFVVIDAGHGGHDPGTEAAGDVAEKDLTLQIATRLRDALAASGIDARLTRDRDIFLTLAERTQMANRNRADLFVSIHLNASPDSNTAGIETYYLNNTTDRATIRLAHMENDVAGGYGAPGEPNLNYILTDLRQQDKANESASLARMIEAETVADIDASMGIRLNELGAKQGPFYVLVGALMPSVLVECGFLSNPDEARLLQSPRYQQALADGIARAVMHYFNADAAVGNL